MLVCVYLCFACMAFVCVCGKSVCMCVSVYVFRCAYVRVLLGVVRLDVCVLLGLFVCVYVCLSEVVCIVMEVCVFGWVPVGVCACMCV